MSINNDEIENKLNKLKSADFPVNISTIIKSLELELLLIDDKEYFSGSIEKDESNKYIIKVNANHPIERQRFTIAHEIGHYLLHKDEIDEKADHTAVQDFSDTYVLRGVGRNSNNSLGATKELEANEFAARLLMPKDSVIDQLKKLAEFNKGFTLDDYAKVLCNSFIVSKEAMKIRINNILYFDY